MRGRLGKAILTAALGIFLGGGYFGTDIRTCS